MPSLVAGGRHLGNTRVLHDDRADHEDLMRLVAAVERQADDWRVASVVFPYLDEGDTALVRVLRRGGYRSFVSGHYSRLAVPAEGFAGYLAGLPRKRRVSVAAERRRIRSAGVKTRLVGLADVDPMALSRLETELLGRYGIGWDPTRGAAILTEVAEVFGRDALVSVGYADGRLRGFGLVLAHGDQWYGRQAGFDYAYQSAHKLPLYFELIYYRLVEEAAGVGIDTLHYGLGSQDTKRSRGCTATVQRCWVRGTGGGAG